MRVWFNRPVKFLLAFLLVAFCIVETLCYTYFKNNSTWAGWNTGIYILCGVGISIITAVFAFNNTPRIQLAKATLPLIIKIALVAAFIVFIGWVYFTFGNGYFQYRPVNYREADMLPLIKVGSERLLHGQDVYAPVKEIWDGEQMPYLPAMWLPFVPASALGVDIRWTTLAATVLCAAVLLFYSARLKLPNFIIAVLALVPAFYMLTFFYTEETREYFALSEEAVPALFYLLLGLAFATGNVLFISVTLALCTLSRYTLIPFLPFFFLWLLIDKNYKAFWKITAIYTLLIVVIFIIPFFSKRPEYFLSPPPGYLNGESRFWDLDLVKQKTNLGIGFLLEPDSAFRSWLRIFMLGLPVLWSSIWLFIYWRCRQRLAGNKWLWLLVGIKGSLLLFYLFLAQPFPYLYIVPTIISYALLLGVVRQTDFAKQ